MITKKISLILLCGLTLYSLMTRVEAREAMVDPTKNAKIQRLSNLSTDDAFNKLKDADFFYDDEFIKKGIGRAFKNRKEKAVQFAIEHIKTGKKTRDIEEAKNFHIAKIILLQKPQLKKGEILMIFVSFNFFIQSIVFINIIF